MSPTKKPLRALLVEDTPDDAELVVLELRAAGYFLTHERVENEQAMREALARAPWDVVIADYEMPGFGALCALRLLHTLDVDLPFIIVSGTVGEEVAIEGLKGGAHDFMGKSNLTRLAPAIERELREAATRNANRLADEALRASEERFRTLVDSIEDLVFTLDCNGRYSDGFGRWLQREGRDPGDFVGKTAAEFLGPEAGAPHDRAHARALAGEQVVFEWSIEREGVTRHFQTSLSPQLDAAGKVIGVVGVGREITELRRMQAQLLFSDRMVSVGTLAAGVAHEINNPLACVLANLDLVAQQIGDLTADPKDAETITALGEELTDCLDGARRVRDIVRDLKIFSRGGDDKLGPVHVKPVLESSLRMAWNELRHRARIVRDYAELPPALASDARLGQVFLNLIVNAAQAMAEGKAELNELRISTRLQGNRIAIEIADTGPGIPDEVMQHLFMPFISTKPVGEGTGLGLSICKGIVTSLGGDISVDTQLGRGTTFTILLPVTVDSVAPPAVRPSFLTRSRRRGHVLLVDDDLLIGKAVKRALSDVHDVLALPNARQALQRIRAGERFDVILCDIMMPELSGMDFYEELRTLAAQQADAVVFLTGGAFTPRARQFLDEVPNTRIDKPFDMQSLRALVTSRVS